MIAVSDVIYIHDVLIQRFGGAPRIRDMGLLESALARPFQTFDGKELYSGVVQKAAAVIESLLINHPFVDGNKRIGYVVMRLFLMENGMDINATQNEKYEFVIKVASGEFRFQEINDWINQHL